MECFLLIHCPFPLTFLFVYFKLITQQSSLQCSALFNSYRLGGMPSVLILPT